MPENKETARRSSASQDARQPSHKREAVPTSTDTDLPEAAPLPPSYTSVAEEHRIEYIIEKSRFIATACPCTTEAEAQAFIARISKEFWDASHNCTAWCLGPRQEQQRSSDNGEPSGTAGKPMLEVLKKMGITNTAIVVSRYFGGIKLGAGGLIRAYSHSAAEVLHAAPKSLHAPRQLIHLTIAYNAYGAVEQYLKGNAIHYEADFQASVELLLYCKPDEVGTIQEALTNITSGDLLWQAGPVELMVLPFDE